MKKAILLCFVFLFAFGLSAQLPTDKFFKIQHSTTGFYLGVDGKTAVGTPVLQQSTIGEGGEWDLVFAGDGYYYIQNRVSNLCISNYSNNGDGAALKQDYPDTDGLWKLLDIGGGFYKLRNKLSDKVMFGEGTTTHTPVIQKATTSGGSWKLVPASTKVVQFSMLLAADPQYPWCQDMSQSDNAIEAQSEAAIKAQTKSINNTVASLGSSRVKGIIVNGDLTAFCRKEEMDKTMEFFKPNTKVYLGMGNHDYSNCLDDCHNNAGPSYMINYMANHIKGHNPANFDYQKSGNTHTGSLAYSWDINNIHFVQLHNHPAYEYTWEGTPNGSATQQTFQITSSLNWLENDLNAARKAGKGIIVNMHDGDNPFSSYQYPAAHQQFKDILAKYEVAAVFIGHLHDKFGKKADAPFGNVPVFYCGAPFYNNYLVADFLANGKMVVKEMTFSNGGNQTTESPVANHVPIPQAAKTLPISTVAVTPVTAYTPANKVPLEFHNKSSLGIRCVVSYLDAQKQRKNWYAQIGAGQKQSAWLPDGSTVANYYVYVSSVGVRTVLYDKPKTSDGTKTAQKILGSDRSGLCEITGSSPGVDMKWTYIDRRDNYVTFKNTAAFSIKCSIKTDKLLNRFYTNSIPAGGEETLYFDGALTDLNCKVQVTGGKEFTLTNPGFNTCYKAWGALGSAKFGEGCD
jgi:cytolysin (calcineurin-like family phosphatase)